MVKPFKSVNPSLQGFQRCLKKIPGGFRELVDDAIADLLLDPIPGRLGFKKLNGYRNPSIYTITIGGHHAYKLSMELKDGVAILRRVGTHKEIDNNP
jgi:mRNA-degrading endonuclease RelE of RelBE toxin-antitoxin system